jgi:hypothetical protein
MSYSPQGPQHVVVNMLNSYTIYPMPPVGSIITWFAEYADATLHAPLGMPFVQVSWSNKGHGRVGVSVQDTADVPPGPPEWITVVVETDQP